MAYPELYTNQFGTTVGLWHLNGNSTDSSGNNLHGTNSNITFSTANGKLGQGAGGSGTTSYITPGTSTLLQVTTGDATWGFWGKVTTAGTNKVLFCRGAFQVNGYYFQLNTSLPSTLSFRSNQAAAVQTVTTTNTVAADTWYHFAVVKSGTTVRIYLNGSECAYSTSQTITNPTASTRSFYILSYDSGTDNPVAAVDEFFMTSTALTANQIRQIYAYQKGLLGRYA